MDRFDALQAFARVVEAGSFTKAAQTLHLSKSSVTQLVQQLEARLRVKLLHRTTRRLKVTAEGAAYYDRVCRLLADLEDADASLAGASTQPRGSLRVDVPSPLASLVLVPALPDFQARYPDIQLELGVSDRIVDLIGDNVDCVLRGGPMTNPSLVARRVGDLQLGLYAAPGYLQRHGTPAHPSELLQPAHRWVGYGLGGRGKIKPVLLRRGPERLSVQGRCDISVDDGNAYRVAGLTGLGLLWLPRYMAEQPVATGALVALFSDWQIEPMPLYVAYAPNRHVSARLRAFIDWVLALMAVHAPRIGP